MKEKGKRSSRINRKTLGNARRLRREMTHAERKLWWVLRDRNLGGYKFRRQHPVENYIVDFYCAEVKLVVELDGDVHATPEKIEQDRIRSGHLEGLSFKVIRFTNDDVRKDIKGVTDRLIEVIGEFSEEN